MVSITPAGAEISHYASYHVYRVHAYSLPTKLLRGFITSVMCATCLTNLIPLKLISLTISGETQNTVTYIEERKLQWEERRPVPPKRQYIYQTAPRHIPLKLSLTLNPLTWKIWWACNHILACFDVYWHHPQAAPSKL